MVQPELTWWDSAFAPVYRWNHRAVCELVVVLVLALALHFCYGILADRQVALNAAIAPQDHASPVLSISIGTITNSGAGSSTQINPGSQPSKEAH